MNMILRLQEAGAIPTLAEEIEVEGLGPESQFIVTGVCAMDWLAGSNDFFVNDVEANKVLNAERGVPIS